MLSFLIVVLMPGVCTNVRGSVNGKAPKEVTKDQLLRFIRQVNRENCKVFRLTSKIKAIKAAQYRAKRRDAKRALDEARKTHYISNQCLKFKIQTEKGEQKTYSTMSKDELYCELILRYVDTNRVKDLLRRSGVSLTDQPTQTLNTQIEYLPDVNVIEGRKAEFAKLTLPNTIDDMQSTEDFFVFSENKDYVELNRDVTEPSGTILPQGITGRILQRGSGIAWLVRFPYPPDGDFNRPTPKDRKDVPTADVTINFYVLIPSRKKKISFIGRKKKEQEIDLNEIDSDDIDTEDMETDDETEDESDGTTLTAPKIATVGKKTAPPLQPMLTRQKALASKQIKTRKQAYEEALKKGSKPPSTQTAAKTPKPTSAKTPKPTSAKTPKPTSAKTPKPTSAKTTKPTTAKTPKPSSAKTPKPTSAKTPKPTSAKTPKPTTASKKKTAAPKTTAPKSAIKNKTPTKNKKKPSATPKSAITSKKTIVRRPKAGSSADLRKKLSIKESNSIDVIRRLSQEIKDIGLEKEIKVSDLPALRKNVKKNDVLKLRKEMIAQIDNDELVRDKFPLLGLIRVELKYIRGKLTPDETLTDLEVRVANTADLGVGQLVVENPNQPFLKQSKYPFFLFKKSSNTTR